MNKGTRIAAVACLVLPITATAGISDYFQAGSFVASVGAMAADPALHVRTEGRTGLVGSDISFETLGLDGGQTTPAVRLEWQLAKRHGIWFEYLSLDQSSSILSSQTIRFRDTVFPLDVTLDNQFRMKSYAGGYGYSVTNNRNYQLELRAGVNFQDIMLDIAMVDGPWQESAEAMLPAPEVGVLGGVKLAAGFYLTAQGRFFTAEVQDYDGTVSEGFLMLEHRTFDNLGFALGYQFLNIDLKSTNPDFAGLLEYEMTGPAAFFRVSF